MSVLTCGRGGCTNAMCHRMISTYRSGGRDYICEDCYDELVAWKDGWGSPGEMFKPKSAEELVGRLRGFMASPAGTFLPRPDPEAFTDDKLEAEFDRLVFNPGNE